jgi:hypothetical protein
MNAKERKELLLSKLLLVSLAAVGMGVVVWLAWVRPSPQVATNTTRADQADVTKETATPPPKDQVLSTIEEEKPEYLAISEWKVRAPLGQDTYDMTYTYQPLEGDSVTFTFKRLQAAGICDPSVGVSMTRTASENQPPYTIDNPEPIAFVEPHYYYLAYAGEPCTVMATTAQKQTAAQINSGDLNGAVKKVLEQLEPAASP